MIRWQDVAVMLTLIIGSAGLVTYDSLFINLRELTGVSYLASGNGECGLFCESYLNITTDYWRICFEHPLDAQSAYVSGPSALVKTTIGSSPDIVLYKKSIYGRTLWVNLRNVDAIVQTWPDVQVDWLVPTYGGNWRALQDGDCWDRGKTNRVKLAGTKDPRQTVQWGIDAIPSETHAWNGIPERIWTDEDGFKNIELDGVVIRSQGEIGCKLNGPSFDSLRSCQSILEIHTGDYDLPLDDVFPSFRNPIPGLKAEYSISSREETVMESDDSCKEGDGEEQFPCLSSRKRLSFDGWSDVRPDRVPQHSAMGVRLSWEQSVSRTGEAYDLNSFNLSMDSFFPLTLDPSVSACTTINDSGTYNLSANINDGANNCINISGNNIFFDCAGYLINTSTSSVGITIIRNETKIVNVTIANCRISNFSTAVIDCVDAMNVTITGTNITSSLGDAISAVRCHNLIINDSELYSSTGTASGLDLDYSSNPFLSRVNITNHAFGISFLGVERLGNYENIGFHGQSSAEIFISSNTDVNATGCDGVFTNVTGNDGGNITFINYSANINGWKNVSEYIFCGARNLTVRNMDLNRTSSINTGYAFLLFNISGAAFSNISVDRYRQAFQFEKLENSEIINSTFTRQHDNGMEFTTASNVSIINNSIFRPGNDHFNILYSSTNVTLTGNRLDADNSSVDCMNINVLTSTRTIRFYNNYCRTDDLTPIFTDLAQDFNTSLTTGTRVYGNGSSYAGNFWTNTSGNTLGFSTNCTDAAADGICDTAFTCSPNSSRCSDAQPLGDDVAGQNVTIGWLKFNASIFSPDESLSCQLNPQSLGTVSGNMTLDNRTHLLNIINITSEANGALQNITLSYLNYSLSQVIFCNASIVTGTASARGFNSTTISTAALIIININTLLNTTYLHQNFIPNFSLITGLNFSDNQTIHTGNFSWNLTQYNVSTNASWVYNFTNDESVTLTVQAKLNQSVQRIHIWFWMNDTHRLNLSTTYQDFITLSPDESNLINVTIDLIALSQTYSNWSLTTDNAKMYFNVSFRLV